MTNLRKEVKLKKKGRKMAIAVKRHKKRRRNGRQEIRGEVKLERDGEEKSHLSNPTSPEEEEIERGKDGHR